MSIQVNDFKWIKGENDSEYIKLLQNALERQKKITAKAINRIRELSYNNTYQWISVTERTPEICEIYLVTDVCNNIFIWTYHPNREESMTWEDDYGFYHDKYEVVAWAELPPQYEEK